MTPFSYKLSYIRVSEDCKNYQSLSSKNDSLELSVKCVMKSLTFTKNQTADLELPLSYNKFHLFKGKKLILYSLDVSLLIHDLTKT